MHRAGQYSHVFSGLILAPYRAYEPTLGRWLNRDPIGERGGVNLYGYVGGNPVNWVDSTGLIRSDTDITQFPNDLTPCNYYALRCAITGCRYYCGTAQVMCEYSQYNPIFVGISNNQFNCIRSCLVREDIRSHQNEKECGNNDCLSDKTIDDYHNFCFESCGVPAKRYPGVNPWWLPFFNPNKPNQQ